jgi:hypothetical protein
MAKDDHEKIDAILAMPLKKRGETEKAPEEPKDEEDDDGEDGEAEMQALNELADVLDVPEDKREAFHEAVKKVLEACAP